MPRIVALVLALSFVVVAPVPQSMADTFSVATYNVRGLPALVIEDRTDQIDAIALLLEDFHLALGDHAGIRGVVLIQELFDPGYHATITDDQMHTYTAQTAKDNGGPSGIGDGLDRLSDFGLTSYATTQWANCFGTLGADGSDCDTNKGFSVATHTFGTPGFFFDVDIYNLHSDAGQDAGSQTARRANIVQLKAAILATSPVSRAVIVMGDTNSLYTRTTDDNIEILLSGTGLKDVWVELVKAGAVPGAGAENETGCSTTPSGPDCELVDKIFFRSGDDVTLTPTSYTVLADLFEDAAISDEPNDQLSDHFAVSAIFDSELVVLPTTTIPPLPTTIVIPSTSTSTSSSTSTSTSLPTTTTTMSLCPSPSGVCSQPVNPSADKALASDCLFILKAAVGLEECCLCPCDVDGNGSIFASDGLVCLQVAVGITDEVLCEGCVMAR